MDPIELNERGMKVAKKLGVDDAVLQSASGTEHMVRFANDSLSVAKRTEESVVSVYLAKDGKRIVGGSTNTTDERLADFIERLYKTMVNLSKEAVYAPLPSSHRSFNRPGDFDKRLGQLEEEVPQFAAEAIAAAREAGARRSAGALEASVVTSHILASNGTSGRDTSSSILLNIRSFTDKNASGHGLSCSATLAGFKPKEAGRRAGSHAKKMRNSKQPEAGKYELLLSPTVAANLISLTGGFASAFSVDAGISYLADKMGKKVASEGFNLTDHGRTEGCLAGRSFDDEGTATQSTKIIEAGVLKSYLHNLTTAKKFKTETTGNAGLIEPDSWNLEVGAGDSGYDEMVKEMKHGIILTSNWYTRFTNYRTGEFSTVPRDGAYLVENGRVTKSLSGLRVSDSLGRILSSVKLLSKEREWIEWWEVDTPTLTPWMLVDGVSVTRAYGASP
ncbi:MAG: TldD/PmbA family protein [Thaumarchaeota archaeon]|nr:TldD/PmbA family protein [Nitrososphaerota archaeon]